MSSVLNQPVAEPMLPIRETPVVEREPFSSSLFDRPLSEDTLCKLLDLEWRDHFQTRAQTWKALQCQLVIAVAIIGFDWKVDQLASAIGAGALLIPIALFGMLITKRHREVECTRFANITEIERLLGVTKVYPQPKPLSWKTLYRMSDRGAATFIFRLQFMIGLFAIVYVTLRSIYGS